MVCAKSFTAFADPLFFAITPAALSIEFAVTATCAICASLGAAAAAGFAVSTGGAAVVAVVSAAVSFFAHAASANRAATMPMVVRTTGTIDDMGTLSGIRDGV